MLYVTTRSNDNPQTAYRALTEARSEDGGLHLPMRRSPLPEETLSGLKDKSFGEAVADILNLFFATQLSGWDVEFAIGRYPVRLQTMSHRMVLTEIWHNPDWDFSRTIRELTSLAAGKTVDMPGSWGIVAAKIAVLFGVFAELMKGDGLPEGEKVDISVPSGDFSSPMAAVFARELGLPIANVVVCCNENSAAWDLVTKGELRTGAATLHTVLQDCDASVPLWLEGLIHYCGGAEEVSAYLLRAEQGGVYFPNEDVCGKLKKAIQVSVISSKRVLASLSNIYKTTAKVMGPYTALTWCGLMDYRARSGESRLTLVLSERSPNADCELIAEALGVSIDELNEMI